MDKRVAIFYGELRTYKRTLPAIIQSLSSTVDNIIFFVWDNELDIEKIKYLQHFDCLYHKIQFQIVPIVPKKPNANYSSALWYNIYGFVTAIENITKQRLVPDSSLIIRLRYDLHVPHTIDLPLLVATDEAYTVSHEWLPHSKIGFDGFYISYLTNLTTLSKIFRQEIIENKLQLTRSHIFNKIPEIYFFKRFGKVTRVNTLFQELAILRQTGKMSAPFGTKLRPMSIVRGIYYCLKYSKFSLINIKEIIK